MKASVAPAVPQAGVVPEAIQAIEDRPVKMVPTGTGVVVAFPANLALWVFPGALGLLERMGNLGCKAYLELLDLPVLPEEEAFQDKGVLGVPEARREAFCRL